MKYIVYLTKNKSSIIDGQNRIYVGIHKTENPQIFDGYLGCGIYSNQFNTFKYPKSPLGIAVKKYGAKSFERTTLFVCDKLENAVSFLKGIVNDDFINANYTYNYIKPTDGLFKPIYQFDYNVLKKKWDTLLECCDFYGYSPNRFKINRMFLKSFWSSKDKIDKLDLTRQDLPLYLYNKSGKLVREINSKAKAKLFFEVTDKELINLINHQIFYKGYYISNKMTDLFIIKPRRVYHKQTFYVYKKDGEFLGKYFGKEVMKVINTHSWKKIYNIFNLNNNWYKDFYITLEPVDKVPEKSFGIKIDVYDSFGNFIETMKSLSATKEKYKLKAVELKNIQLGEKHIGDYIFKYSK